MPPGRACAIGDDWRVVTGRAGGRMTCVRAPREADAAVAAGRGDPSTEPDRAGAPTTAIQDGLPRTSARQHAGGRVRSAAGAVAGRVERAARRRSVPRSRRAAATASPITLEELRRSGSARQPNGRSTAVRVACPRVREDQPRPSRARRAAGRLSRAADDVSVDRAARHADVHARPRPVPHRLRRPGCPADARNLVWRAAERCGRRRAGAARRAASSCTIAKRIPMQAGLGGGSSDARRGAARAAPRCGSVDVRRARAAAIARGARRRRAVLSRGRHGARARTRRSCCFRCDDIARAWVVLVVPGLRRQHQGRVRVVGSRRGQNGQVAAAGGRAGPARQDISNDLQPRRRARGIRSSAELVRGTRAGGRVFTRRCRAADRPSSACSRAGRRRERGRRAALGAARADSCWSPATLTPARNAARLAAK